MVLASNPPAFDLSRVQRALAVVRNIGGSLLNVREDVEVDRIKFTGSLTRIGDIDFAALLALALDGHTVEVTALAGGWSLIVRGEGPQRPSLEMSGPPEQALTGAAVEPMRRAYDRADALEALRLAQEVGGSISATLRNDPTVSGAHWLPSVGNLETLLVGSAWAAAARGLVAETSLVVIGDMGSMCVRTRSAAFAGPNAGCQVPQEDQVDGGYRQARINEGWTPLPSPYAFQPRASEGAVSDEDRELLRRVETSLQGTAQRLVWYWLASDARLQADGILAATFSGVRVITVPILPGPADSSQSEIDLYEWASSGTDPARRESLQQALSLALVTPADLTTAARPALRTAKLLYDLAQRGAVAEALAARRAARAAASESARGAAQAARGASGKAVERALIQAAAATGIVLSNAGNLITRSPALVLLGLVAAVAFGSMIVSLRVELASAQDGLDAELADLAQYRDTLSTEEIADVGSAQAVNSAQTDLGRARRTVVIVYILVVVASLALGGSFVLGRSGPSVADRPPQQLTSTPSAASASA